MVRTVRVRLELDRNDYKQGLRDAANDTRKFETEVKTLGTRANESGGEFKKLGDDVKTSSRELDGLGGAMRKTGNESEKAASSVRKVRKELDGLAGNGVLGKGLDAVSGGLPAFGRLSSGLTTSLVAGVAGAAPALLAVLNGAILAGVGTLGIGAGIAAQARDPQIQAAYKTLGTEIMADLTEATAGFKQPMLALAKDFQADWKSVLPGLKSDWDLLAPSVERFGQGVSGLVTHTMPGFNDAIKASVPIINMLATELPHVGDAFSSFFSSVAAGGAGGKKALQDLLILTEAAVVWLGKLTEAGGKAFDFLDKFALLGPLGIMLGETAGNGDKLQKSFQRIAQDGDSAGAAMLGVGDAARNAGLGVGLAAEDFALLSAAISATRQDSDALAASMVDKIVGASLSADMAANNFDKSLITLGDTMAKNESQLTEHVKALKKTETGAMQNKDAIYGVVQANLAAYDSMIKVGFSAEDAAAKYDENTRALEDQMRQAGYTQAQIDGLIGKYRGVPARVDTDIVLKGLADAINGLNETLRLINGIHDKSATISVTTVYKQVGSPTSGVTPGGSVSNIRYFQAEGGVVAAAKGRVVAAAQGMVASSPTVMFGERGTGLEAYIPKLGISDQRGLQLADQAAGWHGGRVVRAGQMGGGGSATNIYVTVNAGWGVNGQQLGQQVVDVLRPVVARSGNNVQQAIVGRQVP